MYFVIEQSLALIDYYANNNKNKTNFLMEKWKQTTKFQKIQEALTIHVRELDLSENLKGEFVKDICSYLMVAFKESSNAV